VSDFVLDASLALQWFLEDEENRQYSLAVLASLSEKRALVPLLWFYEVGNGLLMACRRKRISRNQEALSICGPVDSQQAVPTESHPLRHKRKCPCVRPLKVIDNTVFFSHGFPCY
jgi:hypothetical protein